MSNIKADINLNQDIFTALIARHEVQRQLCQQLENTDDSKEQAKIYQQFKLELTAHAAAEERHLYVPVMEHDDGLDIARHAITEHHEMDELIDTLDNHQPDSDKWQQALKDLIHKVRHHLDEEEEEFFKQSKDILADDLQQRLGSLYQVEHNEFVENNK